MKIMGLNVKRQRNDAHFQFSKEFHNLAVEEGTEKLKIQPQIEEFGRLLNREDEALKVINKSEFTGKIQEADRARDEILVGMTDIVEASQKHFNIAMRDSAGRLKIVFGTYKNIDKKPLNEQTSAVYNFLQELKGKYEPDVAALGLTGWVNELEQRNNAFSALMKERFDESAAKTDIVLREARNAVDKQYRIIEERINALIVVEGVENYESFVRRLNAIIDKYAKALARQGKRGGRNHNGQEPDDSASDSDMAEG